MKVLLIEWNSYCNEDMKSALQEQGYEVKSVLFPNGIRTKETEAERILSGPLEKGGWDFVFSFNYFPVISQLCQAAGVKYLSWVYDSPYIHLYSYTVINPCNCIFLFDYGVYQELHREGIKTVHYLPLAVNDKRLAWLGGKRSYSGFKNSSERWSGCSRNMNTEKFQAEISFVGSLYTEEKHRLYDRFRGISPYARGYLEAVVQAQKRVYGYNFLKDVLTAEIMEELQKAYPTDPNARTVMAPEAIYADYVFSRQVTALERQEVLTLLGKRHRVSLYTNDRTAELPGVRNLGPVGYDQEMPDIFAGSKINLNITLRSIKTGIPLRAMDIMGCGGFLLTNYQAEFLEYFVPDEDFVFYNDYEDLERKVDYYLTHERERREVAENGRQKVRSGHTYQNRIQKMLSVLKSEG